MTESSNLWLQSFEHPSENTYSVFALSFGTTQSPLSGAPAQGNQMLDGEKSKRRKELTDLIATEQDIEKFLPLIAELNDLLDRRKPLTSPSRPPNLTPRV